MLVSCGFFTKYIYTVYLVKKYQLAIRYNQWCYKQIRNSFIHVMTDDEWLWLLLMLLKGPWLTECKQCVRVVSSITGVFWHWPTCQWSGNIIHIVVMSIRWAAAPQFRAISPPLAHLIDTYLVILCIKPEPTPRRHVSYDTDLWDKAGVGNLRD